MLRTRFLTAAVALPVAIISLLWGPGWLILVIFTLFVGMCSFEIAHMILPRLETIFGEEGVQKSCSGWVKGTAVAFSVLVFLGSTLGSAYSSQSGYILFGVLASISIGCFLAGTNDMAFGRMVVLLLAVCYGCLPWLATWNLFSMGPKGQYTFLLIAVVWCGDTGAYFGGRYFGRKKLAPRMSPNKTMEGAVAGLIVSVSAGMSVHAIYQGELGSGTQIFLASLIGGIFGQMGDLVESTFKRFANVKDSGSVFPGHGGFLDRVDGLMFAAPAMCFILYTVK